MSENMDPTDIVEQLNVYFTRMTDILMELEGTLDKYVGDELMALFSRAGCPGYLIRSGRFSMVCECSMRFANYRNAGVKRVSRLSRSGWVSIPAWLQPGTWAVKNEVVVYGVIGDNVNLAARVMSVAKGMELFITRSTYEKVADYFEVEQRESIMVKG